MLPSDAVTNTASATYCFWPYGIKWQPIKDKESLCQTVVASRFSISSGEKHDGFINEFASLTGGSSGQLLMSAITAKWRLWLDERFIAGMAWMNDPVATAVKIFDGVVKNLISESSALPREDFLQRLNARN